MKYLAFLTALIRLFSQSLTALRSRKRDQQQADYEQDVQDIQADPVGYARAEYGGMRDAEAPAQPAGLPRDEAERP